MPEQLVRINTPGGGSFYASPQAARDLQRVGYVSNIPVSKNTLSVSYNAPNTSQSIPKTAEQTVPPVQPTTTQGALPQTQTPTPVTNPVRQSPQQAQTQQAQQVGLYYQLGDPNLGTDVQLSRPENRPATATNEQLKFDVEPLRRNLNTNIPANTNLDGSTRITTIRKETPAPKRVIFSNEITSTIPSIKEDTLVVFVDKEGKLTGMTNNPAYDLSSARGVDLYSIDRGKLISNITSSPTMQTSTIEYQGNKGTYAYGGRPTTSDLPTTFKERIAKAIEPENKLQNTPFLKELIAVPKVVTSVAEYFGGKTTNPLASNLPSTVKRGIESIPYLVPGFDVGYGIATGLGQMTKSDATLLQRAEGTIPIALSVVGASFLGTKLNAATKERQIQKSINNAEIDFLGTATNSELNIYAKSTILGQEVKAISKFDVLPFQSESKSIMTGSTISSIRTGDNILLGYRKTAAINQPLGGNVNRVTSEIIGETPLIDTINQMTIRQRLQNVNPFSSVGLSKDMQYVLINKANIGLIDTVGENTQGIINIMKKNIVQRTYVGEEIPGYFSIFKEHFGKSVANTNPLKRTFSLGVSKPVETMSVTRNGVRVFEPVSNTFEVIGGPGKYRVYKSGSASYIFRPNIKGYIKFKGAVDEAGSNQVITLLKQNVPISEVRSSIQQQAAKQFSPQLEKLDKAITKANQEYSLVSKSRTTIIPQQEDKAKQTSLSASISTSESKMAQVSVPIARVQQATKEETNKALANQQVTSQEVSSKNRNGSASAILTVEKTAQAFIPKDIQGQTQSQAQSQVFKQKQRQNNQSVNSNIVININTPIDIPVDIPFGGLTSGSHPKKFAQKIIKSSKELFIPELRRRGKFNPVARPTDINSAVNIATVKAKQSLGASIQIRSAKTGNLIPFKTSSDFAPSKRSSLILVQKAFKRLSSLGERAEIRRARGGNLFGI